MKIATTAVIAFLLAGCATAERPAAAARVEAALRAAPAYTQREEAERCLQALVPVTSERLSDIREGLKRFGASPDRDADVLDAYCRVDILLKLLFERPHGRPDGFRSEARIAYARLPSAGPFPVEIEYCVPLEFSDGVPHISYEFQAYVGAPLHPDFVAMFDDCLKRYKQRKPNQSATANALDLT